MSHFYTRDGEARHTQPTKKGAKNPYRPTSITDARQQLLYPSATTVLGVKKNDMLIDWLVRMGIETALDAQRRPGEEMWKFVQRIKYESTQKSRDATDFGTMIHDHLEQWNLDHSYYPKPPVDELVAGTLNNWIQYAQENIISVISAERKLCCPPVGVAGTVDLICERKDTGLTVADYKTQGVKTATKGPNKGKKDPAFWPSFGWQLALYARMVRINDGLTEDPRIVSHVIDSGEVGPIYTKIYSVEEQEKCLDMALTLAKVWFIDNDYWPEGVSRAVLHGEVAV